jgi:hypothetical protein
MIFSASTDAKFATSGTPRAHEALRLNCETPTKYAPSPIAHNSSANDGMSVTILRACPAAAAVLACGASAHAASSADAAKTMHEAATFPYMDLRAF